MRLPEAAVYAGRAARARDELEALLDVIPPADWPRRASAGAWDIHTHVAHVVAADATAATLFASAREATGHLPLAPDAATFASERAEAILARREHDPAALRDALRADRARALAALDSLEPRAFELTLVIPAVDAWGRELAFSLRSYITSWASHDLEHAFGIREALMTSPTPAAMALAARLARAR